MKNNKDRAFTVRFTEEQFHHIQEQSDRAMMTPSNFIRAAAMRGKVNVILDGKMVAKELKAIGNSLNQFDRSGKHRADPDGILGAGT